MSEGQVFHASHEGVAVLRYVGEIRYTLAPALQRLIERLFVPRAPVGFIVDLREAAMIDSTNLGLLASIARRMAAAGAPRVIVISGREDIDTLFKALRLDEVFDMMAGTPDTPPADRRVPVEPPTKAELARTVVEAHRVLMELDADNLERFRDVVALVEKDLLDDPSPS